MDDDDNYDDDDDDDDDTGREIMSSIVHCSSKMPRSHHQGEIYIFDFKLKVMDVLKDILHRWQHQSKHGCFEKMNKTHVCYKIVRIPAPAVCLRLWKLCPEEDDFEGLNEEV